MKSLILVFIFSITLVSCGGNGTNENTEMVGSGAIYGTDDRVDITSNTSKKYKSWASSVAGQISSKILRPRNYGFKYSAYTKGLCAGQKFANQRVLPNCTGFLVGPDLLVTAGHCVSSKKDCANSTWIFDYHLKSPQYKDKVLNKSNVYKCSEVIVSKESSVDYALIRLDRLVKGRKPLKFRKRGQVRDNLEIVVIGHPSGLPLKIADGAQVKRNHLNTKFKTNLDTFGGNSGSPVFNKRTGLVEGILVSGADDYKESSSGCKRVIKYPDYKSDETVTRITELSDIIEDELK